MLPVSEAHGARGDAAAPGGGARAIAPTWRVCADWHGVHAAVSATNESTDSSFSDALLSTFPVPLFRVSNVPFACCPLSLPPPQWIWAGLNLGALGTFALMFFHDEGFPFRLIVTAIAWTMALGSALYGLRQFHRRRRALLSVVDDPETWESPAAPAIVVAAFVIMMLTLVIYAIASGQQFDFRTAGIASGNESGESLGKE